MTVASCLPDAHFKLHVENILAYAVFLLSPEGIILSWNLGSERLLGYAPEEVIGQHVSMLYSPEDVAAGKPQQVLAEARQNTRFENEDWRERKDGSLFWGNTVATALFDEAGALVGYSKITRDFTIRKQQTDALLKSWKELSDIKFALDESTIVAITDAAGVITYANDAFCRISQYTREELIGQTHALLNSGYHSRTFFKTLWETIRGGRVWKGELRNRAKDGSVYWVDTTIVPFLDDHNHPYQYIAIRSDITARKRAEIEVRQMNEELEERVMLRTEQLNEANALLTNTLEQLQESDELRRTFISALTHDLRTPLIAQKRAFELLEHKKDALPDRLQALIQHLQLSNDNILTMINMLLETYQYESGKITLDLKSVDLFALVQTCMAELAPIAELKKITMQNIIPANVPQIIGDPSYIKRVLMNLMGNALENIASGCEITLGGTVCDQAVTLTIDDNGPGIPAEVLPHLFERYSLGPRTQRKIGSGLGLFICKMIMTLHHGEISVSSIVGAGTCFTLTFPLTIGAEDTP